VRAPTPVDEDLVETVGSMDLLNGSSSFMPEVLTAYETGTRVQASQRLSFSVSTFYDVYSDLRSLELSPVTLLPLRWGNMMEGLIYGVEIWGDYRVTDWWRLSAGFNVQHEHLRFEPGSSQLGGLSLAADDPSHQASLRSSVNLGDHVTWDADLRYVGKLPDPSVPEYVELNTRLGWKLSDSVEISVSGFNLLHPHHIEFIELPQSDEVPRSFFVETRWRF
jgi:iron complex outermembrane receptor protein